MNRNLSRSRRRVTLPLNCETLEGRHLLSGLGVGIPSSLASGLLGKIDTGAIKADPAGIAAITSALRGGPGSEFVTLLRHQIANPGALLNRFTSGHTSAATTAGVAVAIPGFQGQFTGRHYDHLAATAAGAILLPRNTLELGTVLRGSLDTPDPAYYVFALDRGAGATLGPVFAARPGITPDALVTISVAPYGAGATGTVTDLKTGAVANIDPSQIQVKGSVVRVFVNTALLPSEGRPISQYRFAMWTSSQLNGGIESVGSFLPDTTMIPVGVSKGGGRG
jgi:hypothetical protein